MSKTRWLLVGGLVVSWFASMALAQFPRTLTAPQVVAGRFQNLDFTTTLTFQSTLAFPCPVQVQLHQGVGVTVTAEFLVNGQSTTNPFTVTVPASGGARSAITTVSGLFQGAATINDFCGNLTMTAGYEIAASSNGAEQPQAAAPLGTVEIFNYSPTGLPIMNGFTGQAFFDFDPAQSSPGLALVSDPNDPVLPGTEICLHFTDPDGNALTPEHCVPFDGRHTTMNLRDLPLGDPFFSQSNVGFWRVQLNSPGPARADLLFINVDTDLPQFEAAPHITENPSCGPDDLCLSDNRFKVEINANSGIASAQGVPVPLDNTSGLYFFPQLGADNFEMLVKILDGCDFNNNFWVFAAATTNVEYTLSVTDTETNTTQSYTNPLGTAAPAITDTSAFATCP